MSEPATLGTRLGWRALDLHDWLRRRPRGEYGYFLCVLAANPVTAWLLGPHIPSPVARYVLAVTYGLPMDLVIGAVLFGAMYLLCRLASKLAPWFGL